MSWVIQRNSGQWLATTMPYFRSLGFFACAQHLSDADIFAGVRTHHLGEWQQLIDGASTVQEADLWLLMADMDRVWRQDLEGVYPGQNFYVTTLREWGEISRGLFKPEHISEIWQSPSGPVLVRFTLGGIPHAFIHRDGRDPFLNLELLRLINRLLRATPYRFEVCDILGPCNFILVLSREEKVRLAAERGWEFCEIFAP